MLRVFEAFAGYGSQRMALRNIGIEFEVVGISEIEGDVILSYAAIHSDFLEKREQIDDYVPEDKDRWRHSGQIRDKVYQLQLSR